MSACTVDLISRWDLCVYLKGKKGSHASPYSLSSTGNWTAHPGRVSALLSAGEPSALAVLPQGNVSWQCVRLQVELGESGPSTSCCWRRERERESWMLSVLFVLFFCEYRLGFVAATPFQRLKFQPLILPSPSGQTLVFFKCQNTFEHLSVLQVESKSDQVCVRFG